MKKIRKSVALYIGFVLLGMISISAFKVSASTKESMQRMILSAEESAKSKNGPKVETSSGLCCQNTNDRPCKEDKGCK